MQLSRLIPIFFMLCAWGGVAFSQTQGVPNTSERAESALANNTLQDRIAEIDNQLSDIGDILDAEAQLLTQTSILDELPVNEANIDAQLSQIRSQGVTQKAVSQAEQTLEQVSQLCQRLQNRESKLQQANQQYEQAITALQSINQLLENPLNKRQLSAEQLEQLASMVQAAPELATRINEQLSQLEQQLARCERANTIVSDWQQSLNDELTRQQQNQDSSPSENRFEVAQSGHREKASALTEQLRQEAKNMPLDELLNIQYQIYQQETLAELSEMDGEIAEIVDRQLTVASQPSRITQQSEQQIAQQLDLAEDLLAQLTLVQSQLDTMKKITDERQAIVGEDELLLQAIAQREKNISYQQLQLSGKITTLSQILSDKKQQSLLTQIPFNQLQQWQDATHALPSTFALMGYQVSISVQNLWQKLRANTVKFLLIILIFILTLLIWMKLSRWLLLGLDKTQSNKLPRPLPQSSTSTLSRMAQTPMVVTLQHSFLIGAGLLSLLLVYSMRLLAPSNIILYTLLASLVAAVLLNCWGRFERKIKVVNKKQRLIRQFLLYLALFLLLCYVLAKNSLADVWVVILFERVFFATLLLSALLFKGSLLGYLSYWKTVFHQKRYRLYRWIGIGLPWFLMLTAGLGLLGYSALAWAVLLHVAIICCCLVILILGLISINRLRQRLKLLSLKRLKYGAFIAQDIVTPVASVSKLGWLVLVVWGLFSVMQWRTDSLVISFLLQILNYPIFNFAESAVTPLKILLLLFAVYIVVRLAKWFKTFSYHWLLIRVKDLGVRQSLAIFGQYLLILVGLLVVLNALGIDLTSLVVFAGALGVGIGLGLQDIAKNFISGIIILLERPMRTGDWVGVGTHEGLIKSIGMRAITMQTFDKQEVIIPNGDVISNSFTNWTHSDDITRIVLYVGASYQNEPDEVMNVLWDVIHSYEAVLSDPAPDVVMWEYADSAITYRLQYFIDMDKTPLWSAKTAVLRDIWYRFKAAGIEIPFPQRDIHFRSLLTHSSAHSSADSSDNSSTDKTD